MARIAARVGEPETEGRPITCGLCSHVLGYALETSDDSGHPRWRGRPARLVESWFTTSIPDLVFIGDAADGFPRYGLRSGAHQRGRSPTRRPPAAAYGHDSLVSGDPADSIGMTEAFVFYARCLNCGAFSLVDLSAVGAKGAVID